MIETGKTGYASIQILRGVAALMVVFYHVWININGVVDVGASDRGSLAAGVDIFFVISGFVMVISTDGRAIGRWTFLKARLIRVIPLYWLCLAIAIGTIAIGLEVRPFPPIVEIITSFLFIFHRDSFTGSASPILNVGWTLNYEMYFYLLFALTIHLGRIRQIAALTIFFVVMMVLLRPLFGNDQGLGFRLSSPLPLEFVGGMVLGVLRHRIEAIRRPLLFIAIALVGAAILSADLPQARILVFGVPAAMLVAAAIGCEKWLSHASLWPARIIGDASYSLYLTHPLVVLALKDPTTDMPWVARGFVMVAASIAVAFASHRLIEKPLTKFLKDKPRQIASKAEAELAI